MRWTQCNDGRRRGGAVVSVLIGVLWGATALPAARALTPATLLDVELRPQAVTLASLDGDRVRYFDADRTMQDTDLSGFVRLTLAQPNDPAAQHAQPGSADPASLRYRVQLVDGQRLVGTLPADAATDDADVLLFDHALLGRLRVSLERLAWVRRESLEQPAQQAIAGPIVGPDSTQQAPIDQDRVWLSNGDVLVGFVVEVSAQRIVFEPAAAENPSKQSPTQTTGNAPATASSSASVELAWDRVRAVALANPPASPFAPPGMDRVTLRDGSVLTCEPVRLDGDDAAVKPALRSSAAQAAVRIPLHALDTIDLGRSGRCVLPLSALQWDTLAGGEAYGLPIAPRIVRGALTLSAPLTLQARLPAPLERVAGTLALPPHAQPHAHITAKLTAQAPLVHAQLTAQHPSHPFNTPAQGQTLQLTLSPGPLGPSQSTLTAQDTLLLLTQPDPATPDLQR